ncbi:coiled-coil domain-containing protein 129 [Alligator sinensis]|uniref:Coiled-coil domain-containing protein 129 n=1 Tax=Alligator sinensis TaxID=38654 RepID=A0A3Q0GD65_ALLSI|nr:coiled-coil domain-containing protein 129 [Alligator sinensis]
MASESPCHETRSSFEMKRDILLSTKTSWIHLDEDIPTPNVADNPLEDSKEENIRHWLNSGFFLSTNENLQDKEEAGMVQMTVQSYMRCLHQFAESPVMSRWNSFNSSYSLTSAPTSITELLQLWEKDPVEILLDLGFGKEEPDICTKIPSRFLSSASVAKGINICVFLEAQKQRMDVENPDLYGRFRQLEVLDHVASAFSSLLNNVNNQQERTEDSTGVEKNMMDMQNNTAMAMRAKRRRIGQLLKRVSRQATVKQQSTQASENSESCSAGEKQSPTFAGMDDCIETRTGFSENKILDSVTEEQFPTEEDALTSQPPQMLGLKTWALSHIPVRQSCLLSSSEMPAKDRTRKESNLLLTQTLRKVSRLNCKPPDSFEMEEIQSFEDETPWGNPLDCTSGAVVTRANSYQSDSSGFLEEPSEPSPLQNLPMLGHLNLRYDTHDQQTPQSTDLSVSYQDTQQKPEGTVPKAECKNSLKVEGECNDQREETDLSQTARDGLHQTWNDQSEDFVEEMVYDVDKKEMEVEGEWLGKDENCEQQLTLCFQGDDQEVENIVFPECDHHLYINALHKSPDPSPTEYNGTTSNDFSGSRICTKEEVSERPLIEEDAREVYNENVQEDTTERIKEKQWDMEIFSKADTLIPVIKATGDQELNQMDLDSKLCCSFETGAQETEWQVSSLKNENEVISDCYFPVHDCTAYGLEERPEFSSYESSETCCLDEILAASEPEKDDPSQNLKINTNPFKSVTVQMSSQLVSTMQNVPLSEGFAKAQPLECTSDRSQYSEGEHVIISELGTLKENLKEHRDALIQTDSTEVKKKNQWPDPPFHRHGHLTKSVSLDTGLYGNCKSSCCGALAARPSPFAHCCHCFCCHHCCFFWANPLTGSSKHPAASCPNQANTELQLLRTLRLLQETSMKNISPCTVHEIETMKSSCQHFREKLDDIEQQLIEQQALFSSAMSDEGREEKRRLQVLRQAVRREVAELECQLNDRARQVKEGILMQLDQLLEEQSQLLSELGLSNGREEINAQNNQVVSDAANITHPCAGHSELVVPQDSSRIETFPSSSSASMPTTSKMWLPTMTVTQPKSVESDPQELSISKKETKGPPQSKMDFKTFLQILKNSFRNSFSNDLTEGKD